MFGMLSATLYHKNKGRDFQKEANLLIEYLAFVIMIFIGWFGVGPGAHSEISLWFSILWFSIFGRPLYGACVAYLILLAVSADPERKIPCYRPTKWLRAFLEANFWLPIATFSYSMYIWHIYVLAIFGPQFTNWFNIQPAIDAKFPDPYKYFGIYILFFFVCLAISMLVSILSYICIEKPSIDSRRVFKNKYANK